MWLSKDCRAWTQTLDFTTGLGALMHLHTVPPGFWCPGFFSRVWKIVGVTEFEFVLRHCGAVAVSLQDCLQYAHCAWALERRQSQRRSGYHLG